MKNLIIYFIIFSSILFSQDQLFVGTRPLGMGGAFIAVADDGDGMSAEDLELCIQSHATSKISRLEDFLDLLSFGFRGEALASVAAVSKLNIESIEDQGQARLMNVLAGKVQGFGPSARFKGTRVEIKELFYNIPARLKFLKSDN